MEYSFLDARECRLEVNAHRAKKKLPRKEQLRRYKAKISAWRTGEHGGQPFVVASFISLAPVRKAESSLIPLLLLSPQGQGLAGALE